MTSCPSCGAALPEAAVRFCLTCGHRLANQDHADVSPAAVSAPAMPAEPGKTGPGRRGLLLGLVALVIVAVGGAAAYALFHHAGDTSAQARSGQTGTGASAPSAPVTPSGSSPASASSSSEQEQLTQFLAAVRASVAARSLVTTAVPQVADCSMTSADGVGQLQQAITDRQNAIATMNALSVSAIPNGQSMLTNLGSVLQLSISADRDFIGWMQDPASTQNCPASTASDADYNTGLRVSAQAVQAKNQFLAVWNPLAEQFGLPTYSQPDI